MSLAIMNHDGKFQLFGQGDLFPKSVQLDLSGRQVSEEVQTNLTVSLHFFPLTEISQFRIGEIIDLFDVVRVDAQDGIDRWMRVGNVERSLPIHSFRTHGEDGCDLRCLRPLYYFFKITFKLWHLEVGMGVDQHRSTIPLL